MEKYYSKQVIFNISMAQSISMAKEIALELLSNKELFISTISIPSPTDKHRMELLNESLAAIFSKYENVKYRFSEFSLDRKMIACSRISGDYLEVGEDIEHSLVLIKPNQEPIYIMDEIPVRSFTDIEIYPSIYHYIIFLAMLGERIKLSNPESYLCCWVPDTTKEQSLQRDTTEKVNLVSLPDRKWKQRYIDIPEKEIEIIKKRLIQQGNELRKIVDKWLQNQQDNIAYVFEHTDLTSGHMIILLPKNLHASPISFLVYDDKSEVNIQSINAQHCYWIEKIHLGSTECERLVFEYLDAVRDGKIRDINWWLHRTRELDGGSWVKTYRNGFVSVGWEWLMKKLCIKPKATSPYEPW